MENLSVTLFALVVLVIVLALLGGAVVFAPHLLVLVFSGLAMSYIAGMVIMTIRG